MMILQSLLFPSADVCTREKLFFKGNSEAVSVLMQEKYCIVPEGETLCTTTYFNSFSIGKWKKYTVLDNLQLRLKVCGKAVLRICHACRMKNQMKDTVLTQHLIDTKGIEELCFPIALNETSGVYYFEIDALNGEFLLFGGAYETNVDTAALPEIKLAAGICTFKREAYVKRNMEMLNTYILKNPESPLYGHMEVFISDNSCSLPPEIATEEIHVFPNRNVGGAGGFGRSMIEIKKDGKKRGITHILLMDDDIQMNPDSFLRTYAMLRLLKPEHKDAFIGGHMLKIDAQHIQSEAADHWDIVTHHPVKYNYNLENFKFIVKNEVEDSVNYLSWWYCCMPLGVVNDHNLPLPIFIKRDDIEYGLRNGKKFITLNGVCVWHEPFDYKSASYLEYYYFRNMCIMNSRHRLSFTKKTLIREVVKRVCTFLLQYRYKDAELSLLGVQHYLNGIDWLKEQDAEKLNAVIMGMGYKKEPMEDIDFVFTHGVYEGSVAPQKLNRKQKIIRKLTLNGWLLPANKNVVVPSYQPSTSLFYRVRKALNYEEISNTGFITSRDYHSLFYILKMLSKTVRDIKKNYNAVTREYRDRYNELTGIEFWNKYLFESGSAPEIKSGLDKPRRPKNTKKQFFALSFCNLIRVLQWLLFWLPVKKNRIMVYIHDRKGFTCNPKYVVKKLVELYGDKLEIIWATMHPETCQEVETLGVKVIKSNSFEQIRKYMRTRFFITNDAFPVWAAHRPNQKWLNTWHGAMNYKHIGYDYLAPMSTMNSKMFKIKNRQPNYFVSGSKCFTKDTAPSFRLSEKIFITTGLPRNDAFFEDSQQYKAKVCAAYNIDPNKKLVMFAPTFRRGMKSTTYGMDFSVVRKALSERFGGEWVVLFRNHNFVKGKQTFQGAVDVSGYHDMQELLCAADVLISDYSSCLYDFCFTRRPSFVYATDLDTYAQEDRSFAYPLEKWPYPMARSNEELVEQINTFDGETFVKRIDEHLQDVGAYDKGTASEQIAKLIEKYCI